jgi:hypothetical protein
MKRIWARRILVASIVVFVGIQLVPVQRTNPPVISEIGVQPEVHAILKRACYDCTATSRRCPGFWRATCRRAGGT